jgi:hypothetical protein
MYKKLTIRALLSLYAAAIRYNELQIVHECKAELLNRLEGGEV